MRDSQIQVSYRKLVFCNELGADYAKLYNSA